MYFQYDTNGIPLGFIYNGTQYFYLTNQMGDVIALSDSDGNVFAEYTYDAWGSLQTINTADENNTELLAIANANPLRYRGYYYDNETGYYYLQSRYYDASICRFINADIPEIAQVSKGIPAGTNLFTYCNNNPVNNSDPTGTIAITAATISVTAVYCGALAIILLALAVYYTTIYSKSSWNGSGLKNWTARKYSMARAVPIAFFTSILLLAKQSKLSKKARSTDVPSWSKNYPPNPNEKAENYAKRILDAKYGRGNWKKGPGSEYNKIVKHARRNLGMK